jgi:hypothetical protein
LTQTTTGMPSPRADATRASSSLVRDTSPGRPAPPPRLARHECRGLDQDDIGCRALRRGDAAGDGEGQDRLRQQPALRGLREHPKMAGR